MKLSLLWKGSQGNGNIKSGSKMETVTLTGKDGQNLTCFMYQVYEINPLA
jgi:hypothetical protein